MLDRPTRPNTDAAKAESATVGIGHNMPPPFDAEVLSEHQNTVTEFMKATQQWLRIEKIETEAQAEQLVDQISGLSGLWKKVEEARKAAKKPHDDAGKAVQDAFAPSLTMVKAAIDALKKKQSAYLDEKAKREAAEKARLAEEARKEREAAEERARLAAMDHDVAAQVEAEEQMKASDKSLKSAERKTNTSVKSASGGGRTMAARTIKEVEVFNVNALFLHYRNHPDVVDTLRRLATADVRAAGYDHEAKPIPGINVTTRKVVA